MLTLGFSNLPKKKEAVKALLIIFCIVAIIFGGGYLLLKYFLLDSIIEPGSGYDPRIVFKATLQNPIPTTVQNLQGDALTWQGYSAYLRFNASGKDIDLLIQQGFNQASSDAIIWRFQHPNLPKGTFSPSWKPETIQIKECYEMNNTKNDWTHCGTNWLIIDRSKNEVYFVGLGA